MTLAANSAGDPGTRHETTSPLVRPTPDGARLERLDARWLDGPADVVARGLLGVRIVRDDVHGRRVGRIVETEAYAGPEDRASHARAGRTPRTSVMFGPPGRAYVYLVYGLHHCLNVVCGPDGSASAVLIRAIEPLQGVARMRASRGGRAEPDVRLGAGPARTCQALDIDRGLDGVDLLSDDRLWLAQPVDPAPSARASAEATSASVIVGSRVGVAYAGPEWAGRPWRFGIAGHPSLSRPFPVAR